MPAHHALTRAEYETELDATLAGSFPASDPPSWTFGASPWMNLADQTVQAPAAATAGGDTVDRDSPPLVARMEKTG